MMGEYFDDDIGLYYLRSRWYAPDIGRFYTMDTYEGNPEDPLTLHKYAYAQNNPVNKVDPTGHQADVASLSFEIGALGFLGDVFPNLRAPTVFGRQVPGTLTIASTTGVHSKYNPYLDFTVSAVSSDIQLKDVNNVPIPKADIDEKLMFVSEDPGLSILFANSIKTNKARTNYNGKIFDDYAAVASGHWQSGLYAHYKQTISISGNNVVPKMGINNDISLSPDDVITSYPIAIK